MNNRCWPRPRKAVQRKRSTLGCDEDDPRHGLDDDGRHRRVARTCRVCPGRFCRFFSYPALVVIVMATVAMAVAALFTEGNRSSGEREDRSNRRIFPLLALITVLAAWLPAWSDRHENLTLDHESMRWVGGLYIVGGAMRMWPVFVLGKRFSGLVTIQPGHTLVTTGIYRYIRHPRRTIVDAQLSRASRAQSASISESAKTSMPCSRSSAAVTPAPARRCPVKLPS